MAAKFWRFDPESHFEVAFLPSTPSYLADQSAKQIVTQVNNFASQQGWNPTSPNSKTL